MNHQDIFEQLDTLFNEAKRPPIDMAEWIETFNADLKKFNGKTLPASQLKITISKTGSFDAVQFKWAKSTWTVTPTDDSRGTKKVLKFSVTNDHPALKGTLTGSGSSANASVVGLIKYIEKQFRL